MEGRNGMKSRIAALTIALTFIVSSLVFSSVAVTHVSATITGDTYSGSGAWAITQDTVYTGETLTVYGNITISAGFSLTLDNTDLTIDQPSAFYYSIMFGVSTPSMFKMTNGATLSVTNATSGMANLVLNSGGWSHFEIDNSTLNNVFVWATSNPTVSLASSYIADSTMNGCLVWNQYGLLYELSEPVLAGPLILHHNLIKDVMMAHYLLPDTWSMINLGKNAVVVENTFRNITMASFAGDLGSMVRIKNQEGVTVSNNVFESGYYPILYARGDVGYAITNCHIDDNQVGNVGSNYTQRTYAFYLRDIALGTTFSGNSITSVLNGSVGVVVYGHDWVIEDTFINQCDSTGLGPYGSANTEGITVEYSMDVVVDGTVVNMLRGVDSELGGGAVGVRGIDSGNITVKHSTIRNVTNGSSQGIAMCDSPGFSNIGGYYVFANRIVEINETSQAIYFTGETGGVISWNNISTIGGSAGGIMIHYTEHPILVHNNSVTGSYWEDNLWPHWNIGPGAYTVCAGPTRNITFRDNHAGDGTTNEYPDYNITGEKLGGGWWSDVRAVIEVHEPALIHTQDGNVTLVGDDQVLSVVRDGDPQSMRYYVNGTSWATFNNVDLTHHIINVAPTTMTVAPSDPLDITVSLWDVDTSNGMQWSATSSVANSSTTYTITGLENNTIYDVTIDGVLSSYVSNATGGITFTYAGPAGEHTVEVGLGYLQQLMDMVYSIVGVSVVLFVIVAVCGIVLGPGKSGKSGTKK